MIDTDPGPCPYCEQLQARCEGLEAVFDKMTGVPASYGVPEPIEGYKRLPWRALDAMKELGKRNAQQQERIGEFREVLTIAVGSIKELCAVRNIPLPNSTLRRAEALLSPQPEEESE